MSDDRDAAEIPVSRRDGRGRGRRSRLRRRTRFAARIGLVAALVAGTGAVCLANPPTSALWAPAASSDAGSEAVIEAASAPAQTRVLAAADSDGSLTDSNDRTGLTPAASRAGLLDRAAEGEPSRLIAPKDLTITVDGATMTTRTAAKTVSEVLAQANITLGELDSVSPALSTAVADGQAITVLRGRLSGDREEVVLPFETIRQDDPNLLQGKEEVVQEGKAGLRITTYTTQIVDGVEVGRDVLVDLLVSEPVDEIIAVGTKELPVYTAPNVNVNVDPGTAQGIARGYVADDGQFACLIELWNRESGWNATLMNTSSGAYGIPQSLPGNKMASHGDDWQTNPDTQIRWGLDYIAGRYGTPCDAWGAFQVKGWY